jgi:magnesium-transporting ATPase (P-type)
MSYLVPISLVVTLEMVKLLQVVYMSRDERLYSKIGDCLPSYNSSSVN